MCFGNKELFKLSLEASDDPILRAIKQEEMSPELCKHFEDKGYPLYYNATVKTLEVNNKWFIESLNKYYLVTWDQNELTISDVTQRHKWVPIKPASLGYIVVIVVGIMVYHWFLNELYFPLYTRWFGGKVSPEINIGIVGDSVAVIAVVFLIYSVIQNSKALALQHQDLKLSRGEMREQREELDKANQQRVEFEIMANLRTLAENIGKQDTPSDFQATWHNIEKNKIIFANLSNLFDKGIPILIASQSESALVGEFIKKLFQKNKDKLAKANLRNAKLIGFNLESANLANADLRGSVLCEANLESADLTNADLRGVVDLTGANLRKAVLYKAKMEESDLKKADLTKADLANASLVGSVMSEAILKDANLTQADLRGTMLIKANLDNANLSGADLSGADLQDAKIRPEQLEVCQRIDSVKGLAPEFLALLNQRTELQRPEFMAWWRR